ncbi:hypothetical protein ABPG72_020038 [Tetrahymena utriculariae]
MGYTTSLSTITRVFTQWENEDEVIPKKSTGRPLLYDNDEKERWVEIFRNKPGLSVTKFQKSNELNPYGASIKTIRTTLHDANLFPYKIPTLFPLTEQQKDQRLAFARKTEKWRQKWNTIIFSDESYISAQMNGRQVCWVEDKRDIPESLYQKKDRYPLKVSIWGMINNNGGLKIERLFDTLNSKGYIEVLEKHLLEEQSLLTQKKTFQQDCAKPHTSKYTENWFDENGIVTLNWPPKSPDLNLIEGVWALLKDLVWQNQNTFENEDQLYQFIENEFYNNKNIQESIQNSYATMYKRIQQVIENKGGYIKI